MDTTLNRLKQVLQYFNQLDHKMQVSTMLTLLEIAAAEADNEEITVKDIGKRVGLVSGPASRNVYYWADGHKEMRGGHKMVAVSINPDNRQRRDMRLTPKGHAFLNRVKEALPNGSAKG